MAGCEINDAKFPVAHLEIRNNSSKTSTYFVTVEFTDPAGTRLGEGVTSSSAVAPGQLVKTDTSAIV
ncbi:FxLYD domain-containing protein [Kitasatospora sp. NPDC001574]